LASSTSLSNEHPSHDDDDDDDPEAPYPHDHPRYTIQFVLIRFVSVAFLLFLIARIVACGVATM
jgi:hypothetical protein